jgi:hypothetical protein
MILARSGRNTTNGIFGLAALITAKIVITAKTVRKRSQRQDVRSGGRAIQSGRDTKIEK